MSIEMENENLSEENILKGEDDTAARIRARRAAGREKAEKAAVSSVSDIEEKKSKTPVLTQEEVDALLRIASELPSAQGKKSKGEIGETAELSKPKEEVGIENEILEEEASSSMLVPEKLEIKTPSPLLSLQSASDELKEKEKIKQSILDYFGVKIGDKVMFTFDIIESKIYGLEEGIGIVEGAGSMQSIRSGVVEVIKIRFEKLGVLSFKKEFGTKLKFRKISEEELPQEAVSGVEASSGYAPFKKEPELGQTADAGEKKDLVNEIRELKIEGESIKTELNEISKILNAALEVAPSVSFTPPKTASSAKTVEREAVGSEEKALEERRAVLKNFNERFNLIKDLPKIPDEVKQRMKKISEELTNRLKVK